MSVVGLLLKTQVPCHSGDWGSRRCGYKSHYVGPALLGLGTSDHLQLNSDSNKSNSSSYLLVGVLKRHHERAVGHPHIHGRCHADVKIVRCRFAVACVLALARCGPRSDFQ